MDDRLFAMRWLLLACCSLALACNLKMENPDVDAGVVGGAGGGGGGSTGAGGGGGTNDAGCTEDWSCSPWTLTDAGTATRSCVDQNGCGTTLNQPQSGATALPSLDFNYFDCNVQPVFDRGCSMLGCHGTETDRQFRNYSRGRLRNNEMVPGLSGCLDDPNQMYPLQDLGSGTVMCYGWTKKTPTEREKNFDNARLFAIGTSSPTDSQLLQQPLAATSYAHVGAKLFSDANDPGYQALRSWLQGASLSSCDAGVN